MKKELEQVIESMFDVFQKEADQKNAIWLRTILDEYSHLDIDKPEHFSLVNNLTIERQIDLLARTVLSPLKLERDVKHKVQFAYENYNFIDRHLKNLIYKYEGSACSTDKTRWLIDSYVQYLIKGEIEEVEEKKYWHPDILNVKRWMDYIDSMRELYYGNEEKYVEMKKLFSDEYKKTISKKYDVLNNRFENHEHYYNTEEKDEKKHYEFENKKTKDKGTIILNERCEISYRFYYENEKRYATWEDKLPEWFDILLKEKAA